MAYSPCLVETQTDARNLESAGRASFPSTAVESRMLHPQFEFQLAAGRTPPRVHWSMVKNQVIQLGLEPRIPGSVYRCRIRKATAPEMAYHLIQSDSTDNSEKYSIGGGGTRPPLLVAGLCIPKTRQSRESDNHYCVARAFWAIVDLGGSLVVDEHWRNMISIDREMPCGNSAQPPTVSVLFPRKKRLVQTRTLHKNAF